MKEEDKFKEYISKEKQKELQAELERLKTEERQKISKRIEEAKKFGDLSENAEYIEAKEAQEMNEKRIAELEALLKNAVVISKSRSTSEVGVGSTVEVEVSGKKRELTIVGSEEANPMEGKISNQSPIGSALLGKREGDVVDVYTPDGVVKYKILKIK